MTDKVQKIFEEIKRLRNFHQIKYQQLDTNDKMCLVECGKRNLCNELLSFIDSLQEEPVSEDLEKSAKDFSNNLDNIYGSIGEQTRNAFKAGAKWQKEQLIAKGVDGVVHHFEKCGVASVHYKDPTGVPMSYFISPKGLVAGDKVKVIAIKEN